MLSEQVRATGLALRGVALMVAGLLALVTLVTGLQAVSMGVVVNLYEWPTLMPGLIGALLPMAVWARDERFGPGFLWTLPVDRRRHALAKVFAGWVWLMVVVALYGVWLLALTVASGGRALPPETLQVIPSEDVLARAVDPATLRAVPWAPGPLIWLVPFTGATAIYLLGSALVLGSRYRIRWIIGTVLSYAILSVAGDAAGAQPNMTWMAEAPGRLLWFLIESGYGLDAVLTARTATLSTTEFLTTGQRALLWRGVPDLADWGIATLLWGGVGLLALWAAASRHRERRRP